MGKSVIMIRMNYEKAIRQANSLEKTANEIKKYVSEIEQISSSIRHDWTGANAEQYLRKLEVVKNNSNTIVSSLSTTAETIKRIAKRTYDAEMEAVNLAKTRTYL